MGGGKKRNDSSTVAKNWETHRTQRKKWGIENTRGEMRFSYDKKSWRNWGKVEGKIKEGGLLVVWKGERNWSWGGGKWGERVFLCRGRGGEKDREVARCIYCWNQTDIKVGTDNSKGERMVVRTISTSRYRGQGKEWKKKRAKTLKVMRRRRRLKWWGAIKKKERAGFSKGNPRKGGKIGS